MKILYVSHGIYPEKVAGSEIYTSQLAKEIAKKHQVYVLVPSKEVKDIKREKRNGFTIIWFPFYKSSFLRWYRASVLFLKLCKEIRPDIVHFMHLIELSPLLPLISKIKGIYTIVSLHDYWYICKTAQCFHKGKLCYGKFLRCVYLQSRHKFLKIIPNALFTLIRRFIFRFILNKADLILANSYFIKKRYKEFGVKANKIATEYIGLPQKEVKKIKEKDKDKKDKDQIKIGFLGVLTKCKGVDVLIKAIGKMKKPLKTLIYGWGPNLQVKKFKNKASNLPIEFKGKYLQKDLPDIMKTFDILVIPPVWEEAFGFIHQEGLAGKKIIVASNIGGIKEVIYDKINGFLFKPGNFKDLAHKLDYIRENFYNIKKELDYDLNLYSFSKHIKRVEKIYQTKVKK